MSTENPSPDSIFCSAIEIAADEERAAYVAQACGDDAELRQRVARLVAAHFEAGSFLQNPAVPPPATGEYVADPAAGQVGGDPAEGCAGVGTVIGPYKLLQEIGEGGMGTVFMAQQQVPVKRLVALKVIKAGMDSGQVIARFEAERQALALMDHPNIARVLDAGTTERGRPYFVMELVKGMALTKYCDEHHLTPRQRLELFIPVCQAVQHAHQKGIIHRDLKPSNVLVALYDGRPVPKVIDFGIAKAAGQQLTDRTLVTGFGTVVGTMEYMSPEQAELNQLDIDTRSDIYSLGVVLYELLTGTTPLDRKRLKRAAFVEMLRIIREEEPPRPSTRLSESKDSLLAISAQRQMEPAKLTRLVRGELDWIVMKALEKDRNRRYETANGFAADIRRYLADEPLQACPPSAWYRFRKFARRNKTALTVAGLVLSFIAVLGGGGGWMMRDRAAREQEVDRDRAARRDKIANDLELALDRAELFQGQGKRAEALAALGRAELLADQIPPDPAHDERLAALKERLDADARDQEFIARFEEIRLRVGSRVDVKENRFKGEATFPEIRDALRRYGIEIGVTSPEQAVASVLGRPETARRNLVAALDQCLRQVPKGDAEARRWLLATLDAADDDPWRVSVRKAGADPDGKAVERLACEMDVRNQPPSFLISVAHMLPAPMKATRLELLRRVQRAYPADLWANERLAGELTINGRAAEAIRYYTAALALRPDNPGIYLNRSGALMDAGEADAALADARQSVALAPHYPGAHLQLGRVLRKKGRPDDAIAAFREAIRLKKDFAEAHDKLGTVLYDKGQLDKAIAAFREAIQIKKDFADAHYNLGIALHDKGQLDGAIDEYREAIRINKDFAEPHNALGNALRIKGQLDGAVVEYREAIRINKDLAAAHYNLGNLLHIKGQLDGAITACREAIRIKKDYAEAHNTLGNALRDKGQLDGAIAAFREAIRIKKDYANAHCNLGTVLHEKGQLDEAIAAFREAIRIEKDHAEAHYGLGNVLRDKGQLDGAIAEYREAIRLKKDYAEAHCNLGHSLQRQGEFRQALEEMRRGHELGSKDPRWRYPSAQWVRQCERMVELDGKLPAFLEGEIKPASPAERIGVARVCSLKRLHRAAARFYQGAFDAEPEWADDLGSGLRYSAACAAAQAGCGVGKDADKLENVVRARLRRSSLDWLRADLDAWGRLLEKDPQKAPSVIVQQMRHWLTDTDFAGVRGPEAIAKLPEAERQAWQKLWGDVADTLARTQAKKVPEKKSGAK